jgi:TPR repeat protein
MMKSVRCFDSDDGTGKALQVGAASPMPAEFHLCSLALIVDSASYAGVTVQAGAGTKALGNPHVYVLAFRRLRALMAYDMKRPYCLSLAAFICMVFLVILFPSTALVFSQGASNQEPASAATAEKKGETEFKLGLKYYSGDGIKQDFAKAFALYRKAADQGNANAQNNLGLMYRKGEGVEKDYTEAAKLYRKAADQGNAFAQYNLGVMYYNGHGVEKDYTEAIKLYRKAADQGNAFAQFNLGGMYRKGEGVEKDYTEAFKWFHSAAEKGDGFAQSNLGAMYDTGQGVDKDYTEAAKWYRKAADQGCDVAQSNLGLMYYNGNGVEKDYVEAYAYLNMAARTLEDAGTNRDLLEKKMTPQQISEGQARTKELRALIKPPKE